MHDYSVPFRLASNEDQYGETRGLGISTITFKLTSPDELGVLILENTFRAKGGPARHLHYDQDEWFYVIEGEFTFEVGTEKFNLSPGESLFAPRKIPHVWAYTGNGSLGKILITFLPAGKMESFFREVNKANAMPPQNPDLWHQHGMQLLGPPLDVS